MPASIGGVFKKISVEGSPWWQTSGWDITSVCIAFELQVFWSSLAPWPCLSSGVAPCWCTTTSRGQLMRLRMPWKGMTVQPRSWQCNVLSACCSTGNNFPHFLSPLSGLCHCITTGYLLHIPHLSPVTDHLVTSLDLIYINCLACIWFIMEMLWAGLQTCLHVDGMS